MRRDLQKQLENYRLTTAEIFYHMPDYPDLLQTFIWQELDLAPQYPILRRFLHFWQDHIEGRLHSVIVANTALVKPATFQLYSEEFNVH
jgi:uncharacterized protein Usg